MSRRSPISIWCRRTTRWRQTGLRPLPPIAATPAAPTTTPRSGSTPVLTRQPAPRTLCRARRIYPVWSLTNFQSSASGKAMGGANAGLTQGTYLVPRDSTGSLACAVTYDFSATGTAGTVPDSFGSSLCEATGGAVYPMRNGISVFTGGGGDNRTATAVNPANAYLLNWIKQPKTAAPGESVRPASAGRCHLPRSAPPARPAARAPPPVDWCHGCASISGRLARLRRAEEIMSSRYIVCVA